MAECNKPSSSLSDTLASGRRFSTVLSNGEDEDSGEDASKSLSRTSAEPESILSRLKAADCSGLCCKRSVAAKQLRKRPKKSSVRGATDPSSVTPLQRVNEFYNSEYIGVGLSQFSCRTDTEGGVPQCSQYRLFFPHY